MKMVMATKAQAPSNRVIAKVSVNVMYSTLRWLHDVLASLDHSVSAQKKHLKGSSGEREREREKSSLEKCSSKYTISTQLTLGFST